MIRYSQAMEFEVISTLNNSWFSFGPSNNEKMISHSVIVYGKYMLNKTQSLDSEMALREYQTVLIGDGDKPERILTILPRMIMTIVIMSCKFTRIRIYVAFSRYIAIFVWQKYHKYRWENDNSVLETSQSTGL